MPVELVITGGKIVTHQEVFAGAIAIDKGHEAAVGDKAVEMGVKVDEIPEGLDGDHYSRHGFFFIEGLLEELPKRLMGALTQLSQKLSIKPKMGPEHLGNSKDILPMG